MGRGNPEFRSEDLDVLERFTPLASKTQARSSRES